MIPPEPLHVLLFTSIGLLVLGWVFAFMVSKLSRPDQWTENRFTLYACLTYLPAVGLLVLLTFGGYLTYLSEVMSPLAAYALVMALMTVLIVVPVIPLWRARYHSRDNLSILPGWAALLVLPPFLASTAHFTIGLLVPEDLSTFWWIPIDAILQVLALGITTALTPFLLSANEWNSAPAGLFHRAWVIPTGTDGWANAFVIGMNPKHTNLFVTEHLLQELTPEQLKAVLAHEHGHVALGHSRKLLAVFLALNLSAESLFLAIPSWVNNTVLNQYSALLAPVLVWFGTAPIIMAVRRRFERQADSWACMQLDGEAIALADALCRIREINGGGRSPLLRWWASHPSVEERIAAIREYSAEPASKVQQVGVLE